MSYINKKLLLNDKKKKEKRVNIENAVSEINKIITKYECKFDISEWLTLTDKKTSVSFCTDENGKLIIE